MVKHESGTTIRNGAEVDIVIVGSEAASREGVRYLIQRISSGFLGLALRWDVLWYGTDYTPQPDLPLTMAPLCSDRAFAMDGICLAHTHIRRRDDL